MKRLWLLLLLVACNMPSSPVLHADTQLESLVYSSWAAGVAYTVGKWVNFNGRSYKCLLAHTSVVAQTPNMLPNTWQDMGLADLTAPVVTLSTSATAISAPSTLTLTANATDAVGVAKVEFYSGTTLINTDTSSPFSYAMGITAANNGSKSFRAKAFDAAGNVTTSTEVVVNIAIATPKLSLTVSSSTVTVSGPFTLSAAPTAFTPSKVEFYSGTTLINTDTSSPYSYTLNLTAANNGAKSFKAKAYNAANTSTLESNVLPVTVGIGDTTAPTVTLQASSTLVTTASNLTLTANATDAVGVAKVEFYSGTTLISTDTTAPYSYVLALGSTNNGTKSFSAKAYDLLGHVASSNVVSVSVNIAAPTVGTANPILFVTQVPYPQDFTTSTATIGNHLPDVRSAPRGGDLWIRYPDGTLKNLTQVLGFGQSGFQGAQSIAVRDPSVSWDGQKALFSMVIGSVATRYTVDTSYRWQIYEITGLGQNQTPSIVKVPNQPNYNNTSPIYGTNGRIIFVSDRPLGGMSHLYPQRDEYELAPTNTGLWSLDVSTGGLIHLDASPSGDFDPLIDSYGRVLFTRWDHLQRDQEADADFAKPTYGTFDYSDETANALALNQRIEIFPEPRSSRTDLLVGTPWTGHTINEFFPWQVREDGTQLETLNHVGRQDFGIYVDPVRTDDPNLHYASLDTLPFVHANKKNLVNFLQMSEDPLHAGYYYGTRAPEFGTHGAGQIVSVKGGLSVSPEDMVVTYYTDPATASATATPTSNHSGFYRDPIVLSNGIVVAAHASTTQQDANMGTSATPISRYDFRLVPLQMSGSFAVASTPLTTGISKTVSYYDPDTLVSYSGNLWELQPVEVRARPIPQAAASALPAPEQQMFGEAGVDVATLQNYLKQNNLALIISRNVTQRDRADQQQPFNLRIPGGVQSIATNNTGKIYDISFLQLFQGDMLRGLGYPNPRPGRRVLARLMHEPLAKNPPVAANNPASSVMLGTDGSMAAFVPAVRPMAWQLTDAAGNPVVRERVWLTFQAGEIRVCSSCHGLSKLSQTGATEPTNPPQALKSLLLYWKSH